MSKKIDSLESVKDRFDVAGSDYHYRTTSGVVVLLSKEDLNSISKFDKFRDTRSFLVWLKYKLKGS